MRRLLEARPFHELVPDPAMAYVSTGEAVSLRLDRVPSGRVRAFWYNPRQHAAEPGGEHAGERTPELKPPTSGRNNDWVLVLDDAARDWPPPAPAR